MSNQDILRWAVLGAAGGAIGVAIASLLMEKEDILLRMILGAVGGATGMVVYSLLMQKPEIQTTAKGG